MENLKFDVIGYRKPVTLVYSNPKRDGFDYNSCMDKPAIGFWDKIK